MNFHYRLLAKSKYNKVYSFDCKYDDIDTPTEKERAEIREINSRTDSNYINSGVLSAEEVRDILRQDSTSGYSTLSEEMQSEEDFNFEDEEKTGKNGGSLNEQTPFSNDENDFRESDHPRDKDGKFSTGNSSSLNSQKSSYPKIAGVTKGKPMPLKQALKHTNPQFKMGGGYQANCQSCVAVFEARLQGYNIEALNRDTNNKFMRMLALDPKLAYLDEKTAAYPDVKTCPSTTLTGCQDWLKENIKPGQRWAFAFKTKDDESSGHIVVVTKDIFGNLTFYDPQTAETFDELYLKNVDFFYGGDGLDIINPPELFRIDDKDLNIPMLNKISKPHT